VFQKFIKFKLSEIEKPRNLSWSKRQLRLEKELLSKPLKYPLIISKDMKLLDGNHRYQSLLNNFGEEYEIVVRKISITKRVYNLLVFLFSPILIPVGVFYFCKSIFN